MEGRATFMASAPANRKDEQKFATCLWLRGGGKEKGNVGCQRGVCAVLGFRESQIFNNYNYLKCQTFMANRGFIFFPVSLRGIRGVWGLRPQESNMIPLNSLVQILLEAMHIPTVLALQLWLIGVFLLLVNSHTRGGRVSNPTRSQTRDSIDALLQRLTLLSLV